MSKSLTDAAMQTEQETRLDEQEAPNRKNGLTLKNMKSAADTHPALAGRPAGTGTGSKLRDILAECCSL